MDLDAMDLDLFDKGQTGALQGKRWICSTRTEQERSLQGKAMAEAIASREDDGSDCFKGSDRFKGSDVMLGEDQTQTTTR